MKNYAIEIRKWPINVAGWYVSPTGLWLKVGAKATIHPKANLGNRASVGKGASVGEWARVGEWASVGEGASVGNRASVIPAIIIPSGKIEIVRSTIQMQGPNYPAILLPGNILCIGCQSHPLDEWDRIKDKLYESHAISDEDREQYDRIIKAMRIFAQ